MKLKLNYIIVTVMHIQASKWCTRGVDLLASQGIEQCTTESGAESALHDIDAFSLQVSELQIDDLEQFRQQCTQLLDSTAVVCPSNRMFNKMLYSCSSVTLEE